MTAEVVDLDPGWMWTCRTCARSSDYTWTDEQDAAADADAHDAAVHEPADFDFDSWRKFLREDRS